jgi:hypothetical protein
MMQFSIYTTRRARLFREVADEMMKDKLAEHACWKS